MRALLSIIGVTVFLSACSGSKLTKDDVRLALGDVRSFSASGSFLIGQKLDGKVTDTFFLSQAQQLEEKFNGAKKDLDAPAGPLEYRRLKVLELAIQGADDLHQVRYGEVTREKEADLLALSAAAKNLEEQLKDD